MPTKVTAGKTLKRAGATPLLTAFSRPKFRGIAPARPEQLRAVFCPRAYGGNAEYRKEAISNTERRESRWQF